MDKVGQSKTTSIIILKELWIAGHLYFNTDEELIEEVAKSGSGYKKNLARQLESPRKKRKKKKSWLSLLWTEKVV